MGCNCGKTYRRPATATQTVGVAPNIQGATPTSTTGEQSSSLQSTVPPPVNRGYRLRKPRR